MTKASLSTHTGNKAVRFVGVLFLAQMTTAVLSYSVILEPILYAEDFLVAVSSNSTKVIVAMFLDLATGAFVFGIAVILFPILKKHSERIALWYVGFRLHEWVTFVISGVLLLTILSISREYVQAVMPESSYMETLGRFLLKARGSTQDLGLIGYCLGTPLFYYLLFRLKLVPRFISVWGLIGVALLSLEIVSNIFGSSLGGILIMLPLGLNEVFLGVWLIAKGFNEP